MIGRWARGATKLTGMAAFAAAAAWSAEPASVSQPVPGPAARAEIILAGTNLQQTLDAAPTNSVVLCNPNEQLTWTMPLFIRKPLTVRGLNARLPEKQGKTSLVIIEAPGVTFTDFVLTGNGDSVPQEKRAPLVRIEAGNFHIERGELINSSKDGVLIEGGAVKEGDMVGGVVRDIVGRKVIRDTVSVGGGGSKGHLVRNILVENIRCYESEMRGCVEVSDGTDNITVRKVYAESSPYAVDVQDHNVEGQSNRNVLIEDVYAWKCKHVLRTSNHPWGHANLTIRDITARQCTDPLQISNTENVHVSNVRIIDHIGEGGPIEIRNCNGLTVRDVTIQNTSYEGPALLLEDCNQALVDGVVLRGGTAGLTSGICFRPEQLELTGLRIHNVCARNVKEAGIQLLPPTKGRKGTLADYLISGNLAQVVDQVKGPQGVVVNNTP